MVIAMIGGGIFLDLQINDKKRWMFAVGRFISRVREAMLLDGKQRHVIINRKI